MTAARYIALFLVFGFHTSFACTCINSGPLTKREFRRYDTVVKVKILNVTTGEDEVKIFAEVIERYRGRGIDSTLVVVTEPDPGMCGINPGAGEIWLIYSFQKGHLTYTDLCTKSKRIDLEAAGDRREEKILKREMRFLERQALRRSKGTP